MQDIPIKTLLCEKQDFVGAICHMTNINPQTLKYTVQAPKTGNFGLTGYSLYQEDAYFSC